MIRNALAMLGAAMVLDKVSPEPLEMIASALEKLAWGLEEIADVMEDRLRPHTYQGEDDEARLHVQ